MATDTDTSKRLPEDIGDREKERTEIQGQDQDRAHSSDGENSEQVRQQLKNTTIAPTMGNAAMVMEPDKGSREGSADAMATSSDPPGGETGEQKSDKAQEQGEPRGRLRRKRSIEEVEGVIGQDDAEKTGKQARKRSRDSESEAGQTRDAGDDVADASNTAMETERALPADASAVKETANGDLKIRPVTPDLNIGSDDKDSLLISPKNKRTRDQFLQESEKGAESDAMSQGKEKETAEENSKPAKRARDSSSPQPDTEPTAEKTEIRVETKIPPTSGFADTSSKSGFASLSAVASPKSPSTQPQTSTSAFAASGFGKLASNSASPFGTIGSSSAPSPFATAKPTLSSFGDVSSKATSSPFGATLSPGPAPGSPFAPTKPTTVLGSSTATPGSPFAPTKPSSALGSSTGASGFGSLSGAATGGSAFGSGFASIAQPGSGLSSFATPGTVGIVGLSSKPAKPFGAAEHDEEEEGSEDGEGSEEGEEREGIKSPVAEERKDKRFHEQHIETGEENETTIFTCRAKLFNFVPTDANPNKKEWKERGVGTLRLNVSDLEPEDDPLIQMPAKDEDDAASGKKTSGPAPPKARLVMRADGSQRVILNSSVQKELRFGTPEGERPNSMQFLFQGTWEGQMQLLTLRMKQQFAEELWEHIDRLKQEM